MRTGVVSPLPALQRSVGSRKAGGCDWRCRPSLEPTSTTYCSAAQRFSPKVLAMSPPPEGAAEVRRLVDTAEDIKPEPPRPLMRELPPADPFPVDELGGVLGAAARAIHDRLQAPLAICGQSVLAAATL